MSNYRASLEGELWYQSAQDEGERVSIAPPGAPLLDWWRGRAGEVSLEDWLLQLMLQQGGHVDGTYYGAPVDVKGPTVRITVEVLHEEVQDKGAHMTLTPVDWDSLYARLMNARIQEITAQGRRLDYPPSVTDAIIESIRADAAIACARDRAYTESNQVMAEHTERVARLFTLLATKTLTTQREIDALEAQVFLPE